jgi:hypothetical protein
VSRLLLLVGGLVSGTLLGLFGAVLTILVFGPGGYSYCGGVIDSGACTDGPLNSATDLRALRHKAGSVCFA